MPSKKDNGQSGYGNPPTHTRFKPGQSGNPRGRRKRTDDDIENLFIDELLKPVRVLINGKHKTVPAWKLIASKLIKQAIQGDHKAVKLLKEYTEFQLITKAQKQRNKEFNEKIFNDFLRDCDKPD